MFGIDAPEILVIAVVALVVIGPKELPGLLRTVGRWVASMRVMASEFRGHVDDMVRQSELDELKKSVQDIKDNTVLDLQSLDPTKEIKDAIASGEADANKAMSEINQAMTDTPKPEEPATATAAAAEVRATQEAAATAPLAIEQAVPLPEAAQLPLDLMPSSPQPEPAAVPTKSAA